MDREDRKNILSKNYSKLNRYLRREKRRIDKVYFSAVLFVMEKVAVEEMPIDEAIELISENYKALDDESDIDLVVEVLEDMDFKGYIESGEHMQRGQVVEVDFTSRRKLK